MIKSAPLISWVYALLILLFIIGLAVLFPSDKKVSLALERLELNPKIQKHFRVAAVGTSLSGYGFYPDKKMQEEYAKREGKKIEFFRFWNPGRDLEIFDALFERLKSSEINLVLIEAKLLYYSNGDGFIPLNKVRNTVVNVIKSPFKVPALDDETRVQEGFKRFGVEKKKKDYLEIARSKRYKREFKPTKKLDEFLLYAKQNNVTVALVGLPFAQEVELLYPPELKVYEEEILKQYKEKYNVRYISFEEKLNETYFGDLVHVNAKGRTSLSTWLISQIQGMSQ
ncbi:hypothetical protein KJ877_08790 [bacterium]|nr:hypothetical protein [bacterium]MBU1990793.1 hypothetical protein [bacterium]